MEKGKDKRGWEQGKGKGKGKGSTVPQPFNATLTTDPSGSVTGQKGVCQRTMGSSNHPWVMMMMMMMSCPCHEAT